MDNTTRSVLLELGSLIQSSIRNYIDTYRNVEKTENVEDCLPTRAAFDAQRMLLSAAGKLTELVSEPRARLLEVSSQYFEARALHIIADRRIADLLATAGEDGFEIWKLENSVGIEGRKLSRLMRCLCSIHIFREVAPNTFANNEISSALVHNEPLRAYILLFGLDIYSASDYLPRVLNDRKIGPSYEVDETAFQVAMNTRKPRWDWLEEKVAVMGLLHGTIDSESSGSPYPGPFGAELEAAVEGKRQDELIARPEHGIFGLAMLGGGQVFGKAHLYDFPWSSIGTGTVVDIGGGVGSFSLELSRIYPDLRFVVQDRQPVLQQAQSEIWPRENVLALTEGRVDFMPHDFFDENPVRDAEVYWLRYIMHDWSDDYCVRILSAIRPSMGPQSRILICDQVMDTTLGSAELTPAPAPLPANWGYYTRYSHQRDLAMMSIINGIERTPQEFKEIIERAGLHLRRIWDCRSQVSLIEVVNQGSTLI